MKCIIIDDEPLAIRVITNHVEQVTNLKLVGSFEKAMDGFAFLQKNEVDLIFLDIQMPKITGLMLLKSLRKKPYVILCTAYREYALEGFELDVIDYLLKPISFDRFLQAVDKVFLRANLHRNTVVSNTQIPAPKTNPFIFVKAEKEHVKINLEEILYVESLKNHVRIKTNTTEVITLKPIGQMEEKLPPQHFIRVHRSYIIALKKVDRFTPSNITISGKLIPIGRFYKQVVLDRLQDYLI